MTRQSIRLTLISPSTLTAHLSESTLTITSIPQLCQLLIDEVERGLLERIKELGSEATAHVGGSWFVDLLTGCTVGRWAEHIVCVEPCTRLHSSSHCSSLAPSGFIALARSPSGVPLRREWNTMESKQYPASQPRGRNPYLPGSTILCRNCCHPESHGSNSRSTHNCVSDGMNIGMSW